jgi:hypothetical protein
MILIAILTILAVASGAYLAAHRSPASMQRVAQMEVDFHRTRSRINGAILKVEIKSDARRLRRELRRELDDLDREG